MQRILGFVLVLTGALALSVGISVAGASTKFSSTEQITGSNLVLDFEEGSLKRFASVDYQLDATGLQRWGDCAGQAVLTYEASGMVTLTPDDKGRVTGTLTLVSPPSGFLCGPQHVEYTNVVLTNLTTGHVYRLESISRDSP